MYVCMYVCIDVLTYSLALDYIYIVHSANLQLKIALFTDFIYN